MTTDANKKHYFSVLGDQGKIKEILEQIDNDSSEVVLWKQGQTPEEAETFQKAGHDSGKLTLTLKAKGLMAKFKTSSLVKEEIVLFKGIVDKTQYFCTGTLDYDKATANYTFKFTGDFYFSEQRTNYRLVSGRHAVIQFKIDDEVFDCQDISAGGTSFVTAPSNMNRFVKGKVFENCTLRLNREQFIIPQTKIASIWELKDSEENVIKIGIGIQFVDLTPRLDEDLCKHINSEARAEEIRRGLLEEKNSTKS